MAEDGTCFRFEGSQTSLIGFDCLGVVLQADTALIGEYDDSVAKISPSISKSVRQMLRCIPSSI